MKAAVLEKFNAPWTIKELPQPKPQSGQILIKVHASGLCGTDLHIHHGIMPISLPLVCGHEPVGEIVEVGAGVENLKVGDRVGVCWNQKGCGRCPSCQSQRELYCMGSPKGPQTWMNLGGGNSEFMLAWAAGCILLPEKLSYEYAAPLFCAGYTIASGYANAHPKPGERIAVLGIGGLGHLALQYAKAKGHPVIALTHSAEKVDLLKSFGADEIVVIKKHVGKELAAVGGADIILGTGNSCKVSSESLEGLLPEGRFIGMGIDTEEMRASPVLLLSKQLTIKGSKQNKRADLIDILSLAAKGKVKPMVELYSLEEINHVLTRLNEGKVRFRAVIQHQH